MSDPRDTLNDEAAERPAAAAGGRDFDVLQIGFWAALAIAGGVAAMAVTWPGAVGPAGPVLIIACGAMGLVLVLWWLRGAGRRLGVFPERGAAEAAALSARRPVWLEALGEPALISDRGGASVAANAAYLELSQVARDLGDASHAPSVDRLFGANPGMAAPIYRLSKAAKAGVSRTEVLPAILFGDAHVPVQYEASVASLGKSRALWRLRRVEAGTGSGAVDPRALYVEDAPVGFFSARRDGRIVYINQTLRGMLGLPDDPAGLRLEDIMRPEGLKLMRREVRGASSQRAEVVMRARDGVETPAQLITTWSAKGPDALTRSIVYLPNGSDAASRRSTPAVVSEGALGAPSSNEPMVGDAPCGAVRLDGESVETAVMLDANRALVEMTGGGADYTFDCTGNTTVMRQALEACHRGWGESIVIGVAEAGKEIATRPFQLVTGRVWRGSAFGGARGRTDTPKIVDWYMDGKIEIDPMITHTLPLERINEAFDLMHAGESIRSVVVF